MDNIMFVECIPPQCVRVVSIEGDVAVVCTSFENNFSVNVMELHASAKEAFEAAKLKEDGE